jgi:hypothetical protein
MRIPDWRGRRLSCRFNAWLGEYLVHINRVAAHHLLGNRGRQRGIQHGRISFPFSNPITTRVA